MQRQCLLSFRWLRGDRAAPWVDMLRYLTMVLVLIVTRSDLFVWLVLNERYQRHVLVHRGAMAPHDKVFNLSDCVFLDVWCIDETATTLIDATQLVFSVLDSGVLTNVGRGGNAGIMWCHTIQKTWRVVFGRIRSQSWLILDMLFVVLAIVVLLGLLWISLRWLIYLNHWLLEFVVFDMSVWMAGRCDYGWIL